MTFANIGGSVAADRDDTFVLLNRGYSPDVCKPGQWFEITQEMFTYFMAILPPQHFQGGAFMLSEAKTASLSDAFIQNGDRFYCLTIERNGGAAFTKTVANFRGHLNTWVAA